MTAAWEQPGRTDSAAYDAADAGQSLADEQRLEAKSRELAAESFDHQSDKAIDWLNDANAGEGSLTAATTCAAVLFAAIYESSADLSLVRDGLRTLFVDECNEDYDADAAESLAAEDADAAADFEGEV